MLQRQQQVLQPLGLLLLLQVLRQVLQLQQLRVSLQLQELPPRLPQVSLLRPLLELQQLQQLVLLLLLLQAALGSTLVRSSTAAEGIRLLGCTPTSGDGASSAANEADNRAINRRR